MNKIKFRKSMYLPQTNEQKNLPQTNSPLFAWKTDLKEYLEQHSLISPGLLKDDRHRQFILRRLNCPDADVQFFKCNGTDTLKIKIPRKMVEKKIHAVVLNFKGKFAWQFHDTANDAILEIPRGKCRFADELQAVIVPR
ncbi:MAG: hypothetical protein GY749_17580 [Desulfobacteraceae bacterium]|nr:hypothetical protein [Desulfobacteraceae bacterium]